MSKKLFGKVFILLLVVGLLFAVAPTGQVAADTGTVNPALQLGADRLTDLQNTDGGWDWPLDNGNPATGSALNTLGPITKGLAQAYLHTADANHLAAVSKAASLFLTKTTFATSDGYLAAQLDAIFITTTYTDYVKANFYDKLEAGNYVRDAVTYDTPAYVTYIRNSRTGRSANLAAWDLGLGLVSAASCGVTGTELQYWIDGVKAEINELDDYDDSAQSMWYFTDGLSGALYGLAFVNETIDPAAGYFASEDSIDDLFTALASYQINNGGVAWHPDFTLENDQNESTQATAYTIMAFNEFNRPSYLNNIQGAADYLLGIQLATGGWDNYPEVGAYAATGENNEVTAEALWALSLAYPEVWVCESGSCGHPGFEFATIQGAINAVDTGGIIHVAAGTYNEVITINKAVTLLGPNAGISPITGIRSAEAIITSTASTHNVMVNSSDVRIEGFKFADSISNNVIWADTNSMPNNNFVFKSNLLVNNSGPVYLGAGPSSGWQIIDNKIESTGGSSTSGLFLVGLSDSTISGNWIQNTTYAGVLLDSLTNSTVSGNTIKNVPGVGIQIANASGSVEIYGNVIDNAGQVLKENDKGGIRLYGSALTGAIDIHENTITNSFNGIGIKNSSTCDLTYVDIYENNIATSNDVQVYNGCADGSVLDATENWWGSEDGPVAGQIVGDVASCAWLNAAPPAGVPVAYPVVNTSTGEGFCTIQAAIDDADTDDGDTITVAAGTYTAVDRALAIIDKSLTLTGESQTGTILDGGTYGAGLDETGLGNGWPRAIVVQANNVIIENMTIRNYQGNQDSVGGFAIAARADTTWGVTEDSIDNLTVQNVIFKDTYYGIRAQGLDNALIQNNTYIVDTGDAAYFFYIPTSTDLVMRGNNSEGGCYWVTDATNAMIGGPSPTDGNTVHDAVYNGIWLGQQFAAGTSSSGTIQNNIVNGAEEGGIVVWNWPGEEAVIKIMDNIVSNAKAISDPHGGISVYNGVFNNLVVTGNVVTDTIEVAEKPAPPGLKIITNTINGADISGNEFSNNAGEGIYLYNVTRSGVIEIEKNKIFGNDGVEIRMEAGTTTELDASPNWWGSPCGPSGISGVIDYAPWYADEGMTILREENVSGDFTFLTTMGTAEKNAIIECAADNTVFTFANGAHDGGIVVDNDYLTFKLNGSTVGTGSSAFAVYGDAITIEGPGVLDGLGGDPAAPSTAPAILVGSGVSNFTVKKLEILNWADGVQYAGVITNTQVVDNFIHDNTGHAVYFAVQPTVETPVSFYIQGNLFKHNGGDGVYNAGATLVNAEFNSWSDYLGVDGTDGDEATSADTDPFTHVDLYLVSTNPDVDNWPNQVFVDDADPLTPYDTITYQVKAHMENVTGASFVLEFDPGLIEVKEIVNKNYFPWPLNDPEYTGTVLDENITYNNTEGWIAFDGASLTEVDGDIVLFEVTFTGLLPGEVVLDFDEDTDEFTMAPGYGPSVNIYADELVDASLDVITRPTLEITGLDTPFVAGLMSHEIINEICNASTGGLWDESPTEPDAIGWIRISDITEAEIASLQFLYGGVWYDFEVQAGDVIQQVGEDVIARFGNYDFGFDIQLDWCDIDAFRVTFVEPGSHDVSVSIYDMMDTPYDYTDDLLLVETDPVTITVLGGFDVLGTISMQGRAARYGVPLTLTDVNGAPIYGPIYATSSSELAYNVLFSPVNGSIYEITTTQPRYLNVTEDLNKQFLVNAAYTIEALELKGGNAMWENHPTSNNKIDIFDASEVGSHYGEAVDQNADVNFDGKVNIQDLALVGGNFDLTNAVAYADWLPTGFGNVINATQGVGYQTLKEAITAAVTGDTLVLASDLVIQPGDYMYPDFYAVMISGKSVILDLNGHVVSSVADATIYISASGTLTIKDSAGGGKVENAGMMEAVGVYGSLIMESGHLYSNGGYALYNYYYNASTFGKSTILTGVLSSDSDWSVANAGELTIYDAIVTAPNYAIDNSGHLIIAGTLNLNDLILRSGGDAPDVPDNGTMTLLDGSNFSVVTVYSDDTATIVVHAGASVSGITGVAAPTTGENIYVFTDPDWILQ